MAGDNFVKKQNTKKCSNMSVLILIHHQSVSSSLLEQHHEKNFQTTMVHIDQRPRKKDLSLVRKPAFCICQNKDADQLRGNREADQRLCFHYTDCTIPLLPKSEISSL